jgi:hypothetical protein
MDENERNKYKDQYFMRIFIANWFYSNSLYRMNSGKFKKKSSRETLYQKQKT